MSCADISLPAVLKVIRIASVSPSASSSTNSGSPHKRCKACDREIAQYLEGFESKVDPPSGSPLPSKDESQPKTSEPRFDLQTHLHRILGVDLTRVPGINVLTTQTLLAEIGPDLSSFDDGSALASWLGLCPDNRVSGGKVLSVKTRKVKNRAATALRMAAQSLYRSQSHLGHRAQIGAHHPPHGNHRPGLR